MLIIFKLTIRLFYSYVVENWRKAGYSVFLWGVNQPVEKQYVLKILGVPYIADTLIGEPTTIGEMNGKSH